LSRICDLIWKQTHYYFVANERKLYVVLGSFGRVLLQCDTDIDNTFKRGIGLRAFVSPTSHFRQNLERFQEIQIFPSRVCSQRLLSGKWHHTNTTTAQSERGTGFYQLAQRPLDWCKRWHSDILYLGTFDLLTCGKTQKPE